MKKLKKFIKIKKNEMIKLRRFKNVHRKNFEKIDVKIKTLTIDNQNLKKIVENYEKRLRKTMTKTFQKDFDRENIKSRFHREKIMKNENQKKIFQRNES